jgi:hypothetical protein
LRNGCLNTVRMKQQNSKSEQKIGHAKRLENELCSMQQVFNFFYKNYTIFNYELGIRILFFNSDMGSHSNEICS